MLIFTIENGLFINIHHRKRAVPGIEPGTSRTLSENHTTRLNSRHVKNASFLRLRNIQSEIHILSLSGSLFTVNVLTNSNRFHFGLRIRLIGPGHFG